MKRICRTVVVCILMAGMFTACSKNDKKNVVKPDNKALIAGTWKLTLSEYYFLPDGSTEEVFINAEGKNQTVIFTPDGKITDGETATQTYLVTDDILAITDSKGAVTKCRIKKLDQHNLVFAQDLRATEYEGKKGTPILVLTLTK